MSDAHPPMPRYAAVIRAYEFRPLLRDVITKLRAQTAPPARILIVDSSHSDAVRRDFLSVADDVLPYPDEPFNFSKALNIGFSGHDLPLTLSISSHVFLDDPGMIEAGWRDAQSRGIEVVYWTPPTEEGRNKSVDITRRNFDGRNGLGNTCGLIPTERVLSRPFRDEVFSAEDQEWTKAYLQTVSKPLLRIETQDLRYLNPQHGAKNWSETKLLNEELAIGHFVNRRLIYPDRILARICRGVLATLRGRRDRARMHFGIAKAMISANFVAPKRQSKYF